MFTFILSVATAALAVASFGWAASEAYGKWTSTTRKFAPFTLTGMAGGFLLLGIVANPLLIGAAFIAGIAALSALVYIRKKEGRGLGEDRAVPIEEEQHEVVTPAA